MKMAIIFLCSLLYFGEVSIAQLTQPQMEATTEAFTRSLQLKRGIDTICVFQQYCNGCLLYSKDEKDLCSQNILFFPTYIFWKEKGITYMTKKDICFDYSTSRVSSDSFWEFFLQNQNKIRLEELRKPQYIDTVNGREKVVSINVDNSVFYMIKFMIGKQVLAKTINNFYFTELLGPEEKKNINHDFNMQSLLKQLQLKLQAPVRLEQAKPTLVKTLR